MLPRPPPGRTFSLMRELLLLFIDLLSAFARLLGPGGAKAHVAENLLINTSSSLLVLARSRRRAPNVTG